MGKLSRFFNKNQEIPPYIPAHLGELYIQSNEDWRRTFPKRAKKIPENQQQFESMIWMRQITDSPSIKSQVSRILDEQILLKAQSGDTKYQEDWARRNMAGQVAGQIGKPDYIEAEKWFRSAAASGNADAFYWLGHMYDNGNKSIIKNHQKAIEYYAKAGELGHKAALTALDRLKSKS